MKAELIEIMQLLTTTKFSDIQSIDALIDHGFVVTAYIARTGQLMSEAKEQLHKARKTAYKASEGILKQAGRKYSPLLLKDYINDCCAEENALYELAERCNRACTHANDLIRTAISALKAERYSSQFPNAA
ncbi:MAG TPA: hypothetical protein VFT06_10375 [Flavisolibacter sp.]|nr:hypothetical protein [Flavisolibacter sp.]